MNKYTKYMIVGTFFTFFNSELQYIDLFPDFIGYLFIGIATLNLFKDQKAYFSKILPFLLLIISFLQSSSIYSFSERTYSFIQVVFLTLEMLMFYSIILDYSDNDTKYTNESIVYLVIATIGISIAPAIYYVPIYMYVTTFILIISKILFIMTTNMYKKTNII